jgi:hypothetical protein
MEKLQRQGNSLTNFVCFRLNVGLIGYRVGIGAHFHYLLAPAVEVSLPPMWWRFLRLRCSVARSPACPRNARCIGPGAFFTDSRLTATAAFLQIKPTIIVFANGSSPKS